MPAAAAGLNDKTNKSAQLCVSYRLALASRHSDLPAALARMRESRLGNTWLPAQGSAQFGPRQAKTVHLQWADILRLALSGGAGSNQTGVAAELGPTGSRQGNKLNHWLACCHSARPLFELRLPEQIAAV